MNTKINTRDLVILSLLIAMNIILSRFLSIATPIMKIGFSFLPLTIAAVMYGPKYTAIVAVIADIIGATLFPSGAFFPGFTITTFIVGILYGVFLYNKPRDLKNIITAVFIVNLIELILNTGNLYLLTGQAIWMTLPTRAVQSLIMFAVKTFTIYNVSYSIADMKKYIPAYGRR